MTVLLVPAAVSLVLLVPTCVVMLFRLLVGSGALLAGLVLASAPLVRLVAPLVGVAGLGARSLAELATAGLLLLVVSAGSVLPVFALVLVGHLLVAVVAARTTLLALALLATVGSIPLVLLIVERFVVGPVGVSCHCECGRRVSVVGAVCV
ncbi:hypothetical protein [Halomicrobium zhouii]|uniref:hypothetical protein n=1 Tax=Halomicrobium zhouii TaxID=767519 RepID=UPI0015A615F5|nr:hypothetical protein [Halomicrobium zhouii]